MEKQEELMAALIATTQAWSDIKQSELPALIASFSDGDARTHPLVKTLNQVGGDLQDMLNVVNSLSGNALKVGTTGVVPTHAPPTAKAVVNGTQSRRSHDSVLDFLLLDALRHQKVFGRVIGLQELFDLSKAYNPETKRNSHNSKLNRWKNEMNLVQWSTSKNISLTGDGEKKRDELLGYVSESAKTRVRDAYKSAWEIEPRIE